MKEYRIFVEVLKGGFKGDIVDFNEFLSAPYIVTAEDEEEAEKIATENVEAQNGNWEEPDPADDPTIAFWSVEEINGESEHAEPGFYEV